MNDEKEAWTMMFMAAMIAQTVGRAVAGSLFTAGHVRDMREAAMLIADESIVSITKKFPVGKGK